MAIAKVVLNGTTKMDTTQVTVTAEDLVEGVTALGADGELITGSMQVKEYTAADFMYKTNPVGELYSDASDYTTIPEGALSGRKGITYINMPNINKVPYSLCDGCIGLERINFPKATRALGMAFYNCKFRYAVLPSAVGLGSSGYGGTFRGCVNLIACDLGGLDVSVDDSIIAKQSFDGATKFTTLVLRQNSVVPLFDLTAFNNSPFASGKAGGTLYVPQALIADYQAATNWSTILGYSTNQILAIEGSIYETQYVDGTPIPTA